MEGQVTDPARTLGVVGAGIMGSGIAQLGCLSGCRTLMHDSSDQALERAVEKIGADLERGAERERWSESAARVARSRLVPATELTDLRACDLVIEAVPEDLELKVDVLRRLGPRPAVATNTSSLLVSSIAARAPRPERVVGMHFFNPPPLMRLVEVVPGVDTNPEVVALARATATAMGRTPIVVRDTVGFAANRCGRPFYGEALRLVDEGMSTPEQVDRICRLGAGFRMGPFELMDLVGTDIGLAVAESFSRQSYGEPRWKPGQSQRRLVAAGRLGRKSGSGWYDSPTGRAPNATPTASPAPKAPVAIAVIGDGDEASGLREWAQTCGVAVRGEADPEPVDLVMVMNLPAAGPVRASAPVAVSCAETSLAATGARGAVGFHLLPPARDATLLELTRLPWTASAACDAAERVASALGIAVEWVDDTPGLVLGRIVSQLVNEAAFAAGEGVAHPDELDLATTLGLNHPIGPVAWGERIGWRAVLARIEGLWNDRHEERYRAAPLLRRAAACDVSLRALVDPESPRGAWFRTPAPRSW